MTRQQEEQYEQDRVGNVRRKLDTLRAQAGMWGEDDDNGIVNIAGGETNTMTTLYSLPTHAQQSILVEVHAHNSNPTSGTTFSIYELDLDSGGTITGSTRRSVPIEVGSAETRIITYEGLPFGKAIGVESEFEGHIGVGVIDDHHEENEPESEQTTAP